MKLCQKILRKPPTGKTDPLLWISTETPAENPAPEHLQEELRPISQGLCSHKRSPAPQQNNQPNLPLKTEEITLPEKALEFS